ncbi:DNA-directed DNA polymerase [Escherichia phage vB_EcoP_PAS7]|uniref:DNA-directed DNA polymerase n=1 Tax=Escherichia phage vB_EcoP_PAS7 TaxID=3053875 RepID=A0AA51VII9_9CAUD|nr:DNA-directed DNA polymerase [Escherichia phage vB_EcoP_PAS7]
MSSILIWDIETQNVPYYGGVATPYCPDNYIVESGFRIDRTNPDGTVTCSDVGSVRYESREEFISAPSSQWLPIQDDTWLMVMHNAAYEISWALTFAREEFEAFLKRGGRVFDTMQGEYIASDFQNLYPSLDETAPKYGGSHKVDGVKLLWQQGVLTADIDPVLLHEYLTGPEGDIVNTALCFYGQCAVFAERGQMPMVWERMDSVLALAYCEFNGVYVDMPTARANQKEQEDAIAELKQTLQGFLPELPEGFEFNWNSGYHMSALVYGGTVKYKCKVPYDPPKFVKFDAYLADVKGTQQYIDVNDWQDSWTYSREVFKSGRNKGLPKVYKVESSEQSMKWGERLYKFEGLVHIQDLPAVLQEKYAERGEFRGAQTLADGTPVFSTGTDAMKELANYFIGMEENE